MLSYFVTNPESASSTSQADDFSSKSTLFSKPFCNTKLLVHDITMERGRRLEHGSSAFSQSLAGSQQFPIFVIDSAANALTVAARQWEAIR